MLKTSLLIVITDLKDTNYIQTFITSTEILTIPKEESTLKSILMF